jgi:hypothetical protein
MDATVEAELGAENDVDRFVECGRRRAYPILGSLLGDSFISGAKTRRNLRVGKAFIRTKHPWH